jgi:uncharacterized damage-inducible protein DinB
MNETLYDELRRSVECEAWYGPSLMEALAGVDPALAAWRPAPQVHTIWELVLHAIGWIDEVRARLSGQFHAEPVGGDWPQLPDVPDGEAWRETNERLWRTWQGLAEAIRAFPPARWTERMGEERIPELGTGLTYAATVHGLAQHNAYHAGQIMLLRRMAEK